MRPELTDFLKKIGVGVNVNKTGEFKDSGSTWRKQTKKDAKYLQEFIDDYYNRFLEKYKLTIYDEFSEELP